MQNIWVVSGVRQGWMAGYEYFRTKAAAEVRVDELLSSDQSAFEELDARAGLGVTWEQYREIQDVANYAVDEVPHVESVNSQNDTVEASAEMPGGRIWVVLEDGRPEEGRWYFTSEADVEDEAWNRNWALWEYYEASGDVGKIAFADLRADRTSGHRGYAPVDPGPVLA